MGRFQVSRHFSIQSSVPPDQVRVVPPVLPKVVEIDYHGSHPMPLRPTESQCDPFYRCFERVEEEWTTFCLHPLQGTRLTTRIYNKVGIGAPPPSGVHLFVTSNLWDRESPPSDVGGCFPRSRGEKETPLSQCVT